MKFYSCIFSGQKIHVLEITSDALIVFTMKFNATDVIRTQKYLFFNEEPKFFVKNCYTYANYLSYLMLTRPRVVETS